MRWRQIVFVALAGCAASTPDAITPPTVEPPFEQFALATAGVLRAVPRPSGGVSVAGRVEQSAVIAAHDGERWSTQEIAGADDVLDVWYAGTRRDVLVSQREDKTNALEVRFGADAVVALPDPPKPAFTTILDARWVDVQTRRIALGRYEVGAQPSRASVVVIDIDVDAGRVREPIATFDLPDLGSGLRAYVLPSADPMVLMTSPGLHVYGRSRADAVEIVNERPRDTTSAVLGPLTVLLTAAGRAPTVQSFPELGSWTPFDAAHGPSENEVVVLGSWGLYDCGPSAEAYEHTDECTNVPLSRRESKQCQRRLARRDRRRDDTPTEVQSCDRLEIDRIVEGALRGKFIVQPPADRMTVVVDDAGTPWVLIAGPTFVAAERLDTLPWS